MIQFLYIKKEYTIPERFEELTPEQYIKIIKILSEGEGLNIQQLKVLHVLLGLNLLRYLLLPYDVKYAMIEHISWVWQEIKTGKNLIPRYKSFHGPADDFNNLTMGEWNSCEIYYYDFAVNKNEDSLDDLVAVLYRKPKPKYNKSIDRDGDIRIPFNANECHYYAEQEIAYWPVHVKYAVLAWFDACRQLLFDSYDIGQGEGGDATAPGMFELIRNLSGDRWGSFDQVEKMDVHKVMREIELLHQEAEELEAKMKTNG